MTSSVHLPYRSRLGIIGTVCVLLFGASVTAAFVAYTTDANARRIAQRAQAEIDGHMAQLKQRMERYEFGLRGARGAVLSAGWDVIDRDAFERYSRSRDLAREFPGARGFGYIRRIAGPDVAAYTARMAQQYAGFRIRQLGKHGPALDVITFIEPFAGNEAAVGLDIGSESNRHQAAYRAIAEASAALTAPITLVQATGKPKQAFLLLLPIYRGAVAPDGAAERLAQAVGWSYTPLIVDEVLGAGSGLGAALSLRDAGPGGTVQILKAGTDVAGLPRVTRRTSVYGRVWEMDLHITPAFVASLQLPSPTNYAALGAIITALLGLLVSAGANALVRRRALNAATRQMSAIVKSSNDAIIGYQLDETVTSWNQGAARMFGYAPEQAIGRKLGDLIVPDELRGEAQHILDQVRNGVQVAHVETRRRARDGSAIDVSVTVSPLRDQRDAVVGASTTVRDITLQKRSEAQLATLNADLEQQVLVRTHELERARRALRTVLDAIPSMIAYWDAGLVNRVANRAYAEWFGVDPERIPGMPMRDLLGERVFALNRAHIDGALAGQAQHFERTFTDPDGRERHSLAHYLPDVVDGRVQGFYVIVHDVSELVDSKMRLSATIRESAALLDALNAHLVYGVVDAQGELLDVNQRFCAVHGATRAALLGRRYQVQHDGKPLDWEVVLGRIGGAGGWRGELRYLGEHGQLHWFDTVIAPRGDGAAAKFVVLSLDITQRKANELEIGRLNVLLGNVLDAASEVSVIATDCDGTITVFNKGAERLLGYAAAELVGRCTPACLHVAAEVAQRSGELSEELGYPVQGFRVFVAKSELQDSETREWTYVRKDGSRFPVTLSVTAMRDGAGAVVGYLGIGFDVSDRKRFEAQLLEARRLAEHASAAKSQFLANMSHEIRTPMNAILGMLQLLGHTGLRGPQADYLKKADGAAKGLLSLLNDVLDFSKIDADQMALDPHPFSIDEMLRDLSTIIGGQRADGGTVEPLFSVPVDLPPLVLGDRMRLQQVLVNLLSNAIKFTRAGHIILAVEVPARSAEAVTLRWSVSDTGIGIAADNIEKIFLSFSQAEGSTARRFGGTGLGLAISRRLVELMGGHLTVTSEQGIGSRFEFEVTLKIAVSAAPEPDRAPDWRHLRALVVDDNALARDVLQRSVTLLGLAADVAASGDEALALAAQRRYDVVLMDWRMDGMNGLEAAARLGRAGAAPPVIMVTAHDQALQGERDEPAQQPYVSVLRKPVTTLDLRQAILAALAPGPAPAPGPARRLEGVRVLLVEDNPINQQVAAELLSHEGAQVAVASGGVAGVEAVLAAPDRFDVVLMDVQMPDMDGLAATARIRATPGLQALPILALTANAAPSDRDACVAAGMDGHVGKPFDLEQLIGAMRAVMDGRERASGARPGPAPDRAAQCDPVDEILRRFGGRLDIYRGALSRFGTGAGAAQLLDQLGQQAEAGQVADAAATAHALKGVAATVGACALASHAARCEAGLLAVPALVPTQAQLRDMRAVLDDSIRTLQRQLPPPDTAKGSAAPLLPELERLRAMLARGQMDAIALLERLSADQRGLAAAPAMAEIAAHVYGLQFELAADRTARLIDQMRNA